MCDNQEPASIPINVVRRNTGDLPTSSEMHPSRSALVIASRAYDYFKERQDKSDAGWMTGEDAGNRYLSVRGQCVSYSNQLADELISQGIPVITIQERHTFNDSAEGHCYPHTGCIVEIGTNDYLWIDGTYCQYAGPHTDIVASFFQGTLSQIRGHLQRTYHGRWQEADKTMIDEKIESLKKCYSSGQWTNLDILDGDINSQVIVQRQSLEPVADEQLQQDIETRTMDLVKKGFEVGRLDHDILLLLVTKGLLTRRITPSESGAVEEFIPTETA